MKNLHDPFKDMFDPLQDKSSPTDEQKEKMMNHVLAESRLQDTSLLGKLGRWITVYPWRFAFSAATAQAVVCTLLFGTGYTNFILSFFGG